MRTIMILACAVLAWTCASQAIAAPINLWSIPLADKTQVDANSGDYVTVGPGKNTMKTLLVWRKVSLKQMFGTTGQLKGPEVFAQWKTNCSEEGFMKFHGMPQDEIDAINKTLDTLNGAMDGENWPFKQLYKQPLKDVVKPEHLDTIKQCFDELIAQGVMLPFYPDPAHIAPLLPAIEQLCGKKTGDWEVSDFYFNQVSPTNIPDDLFKSISESHTFLFTESMEDYVLAGPDAKLVHYIGPKAKCCNVNRICQDNSYGVCTMVGLYCSAFSTKCP